jgi:general secretion pathway protein D
MLAFLLNAIPTQAASGVVMNFSDVDISTMVKFISELTGKNFVLDERVKGKISIFSPTKLSTDEAFSLFTSVLELKGFALVQTGKVYKVVPSMNAKQSGMKLMGANDKIPLNDAYLARVFDLDQISSQEALTFLQPLVSKEGHIGSFGSGNMLLVVDNASNILKITEIVKTINTPQRREGGELVYLKNGSAENIAAVLKEWLSGKGSRQTSPTAQQFTNTGSIQVVADVRLNAVLLFGSEKDKQGVRKLISMLDVTPPEASNKVNVCFLENADATDMAKVLEGVIKGITTQPVAGQAASTHASPLDSGKVTITPDKATNSLVVMASLTDYNNLLQVIKKLDRRSRQVFVQVLIAEVSLDKSRAFGIQAGAMAAGTLGKYLQGGGVYDPFNTFGQILGTSSTDSTSPLSTLINNNLTNSTLPVTGVALLQALEANDLINILSTPNILTSDNKEAEIMVGENVPFKGQTTQSTFGSTESVERKDVGISLKIKPQISEGDYIRLDINQEISAIKNSTTTGAIDLVTTKRAAKTSIVVKDKETIVIGGLIQDTEDENIQKVPFLGDIPGLGWLFKTKTKTRKKTNLMILLTPRIVRDAADLIAVSDSQRLLFNDSSKKVGKIDVEKEISKQEIPAQPLKEKQAQ